MMARRDLFHPYIKLFNSKGLSIPHVVLTDIGSDRPLLNSLLEAGDIDEKQKAILLADAASLRPYLRKRNYHLLELDFEQTMFAAGHAEAYREEITKLKGVKYWEKIENSTPEWAKMTDEERILRAVKKLKVDVARQVALRMNKKADIPAPFVAVIEDAVQLAQF
jgi:hypothetical protein